MSGSESLTEEKKESLVVARDLRHDYGPVRALNGISFSIRRGEIVGLLGPNGAGKTTTMKILTGALWPTAGNVVFLGRDLSSSDADLRRHIGTLPETAPANPELTVRETLEFHAAVRNLDGETQLLEAAAATGLADVIDRPVGALSRGYRQRVGLATAILGNPDLLVLDEPTVGLDPNQVSEIRDLIRQIGRERTVLLSTHILAEVEALCERVLLIHQGRLVADDSVEALKARAAGSHWEVIVPGDRAKAFEVLEKALGRERIATARENVILVRGGDGTGREIFRILAKAEFEAEEIRRTRAGLEDVFRHLTGRDGVEETRQGRPEGPMDSGSKKVRS
ncbi:MAG: ABC transporter ATP-binding protein [Candidatus Hydrogenedentota bacterium]|nr:MAG: ABC transporter ATP-binding protein [Candidatus Hydrogenedentota bacterium]